MSRQPTRTPTEEDQYSAMYPMLGKFQRKNTASLQPRVNLEKYTSRASIPSQDHGAPQQYFQYQPPQPVLAYRPPSHQQAYAFPPTNSGQAPQLPFQNYSSVAARGLQVQSQHAPPPNPSKGIHELDMFIQRSLAQSDDPDVRNMIDLEVRRIINDARARHVLHTTDWARVALPAVPESQMWRNHTQVPFNYPSPPESQHFRKRASPPVVNNVPMSKKQKKKLKKQQELEIKRRAASGFNPSTEATSVYSSPTTKKLDRMNRFQRTWETQDTPLKDWSDRNSSISKAIVGTNQSLEKSHFRLTSDPDPASVRPESVLRAAIAMLKTKWRLERNYSYICDQLKAIRQDMTVQRINNDLTFNVYRFHALTALEMGDLSEFNQCQTQVFQMFEDDESLRTDYHEFVSLRILYYVVTGNKSALFSFISILSEETISHKFAKIALQLHYASEATNYHKWFQYYTECTSLQKYVLNHMLDHMRYRSLTRIVLGYMTIEVEFVAEQLGFEAINDAYGFLRQCGCCFVETRIDCRKSRATLSQPDFSSQVDKSVTHGTF